jgi:hypothetical protein
LANVLGDKQNHILGYLDTFYRKKKTESNNDKMHMVSVKKSKLVSINQKIKFNYRPSNVVQKTANRVCFNSTNVPIPKPSSHTNNQVDNYYRGSNDRFFQKHSDLLEKARNYKYF